MLTKKYVANGCLLASLYLMPATEARAQRNHHRAIAPTPPCRTVVELPVVPGVEVLPDPIRTQIPSIPLLHPEQSRPFRIYRGLDAEECAALAAANSEEAAAIDARRAAIMAELPKHGTDPSRQMLIKGLSYEAADVRNQDATKALTLFYRLAQAQLQDVILQRSQAEIAEAVRAAKERVNRGLLSAREVYDTLRLRQIDLVATQVELAGTSERLNISLRNLLGTSPSGDDWVVRPMVSWETVLSAPDAGESVAIGLASSPQLMMLRTIVAEVDQNSQSAVEQLLSSVNPLVGSSTRGAPSPGLVTLAQMLKSPRSKRDSAENLRMRARQIQKWRERSLEADIRASVLGLESGLQEIAVSRENYALRVEELDRLLKTSDRGLTTGLQISTARLDLFKSQAHWIDLIAALNVRRVELERLMSRYASPASAVPARMIGR